jgi:heme-degrading monooxygenase HmoA
MVKLLVEFEIDDFTICERKFFKSRVQIREASGSRGATLYTREGNGVVVLFDWDTAQNALAYFASAGHHNAEKQSGVRNLRCHVLRFCGTSKA